jgi:phosphate ABC transporter phosphate-binding protein
MRSENCQPRADESPVPWWNAVIRSCMAVVVSLMLLQPSPAQTAEPLNPAHTIEVASLGDGSGAEALRQSIVGRLAKSRSLKVVDKPSAADLILRGSSSIWPTGIISLSLHSKSASETIYQGYLSVELVNKSGQIVWSYLVTPSRFRAASITDDLADQMVARLLDAIHGGAAGSTFPVATSAGSRVALHAAGSTLAAPLYRMWFQSSGMKVGYDAIGSEAGIQELAAGKVDLAGSDMPLGGQNTPPGLRVIQLPTVVGGVVPIYNLPAFGHILKLTPQVLAGIYSGTIRKWNDPRIVASNHEAHLPNAEIAVVYRSDGSGTTYVWSSFLSLASADWKASAGAGTDVAWPVGTGVAGNDGVAELVEKTPNAIGYVELIYAIQHELNYAAVLNPAGEFIKADLASITAAASGTAVMNGQDFRFSILNATDKEAYPIATFTWLLVPQDGVSKEKKSAIASLLTWALTTGQKQCAALGYAPLPRQVVASELQAMSAWKGRE